MNLATAVELAAHRYSGVPAIITPNDSYSYERWNFRINSVAWGLIKVGIRPADRVAICTGVCEEAATMFFAIHKAGGTAVMLNARWRRQDFEFALQDADVKAILFDGTSRKEVVPALDSIPGNIIRISCDVKDPEGISFEYLSGNLTSAAPVIPRLDGVTGTILYTSGTTGQPKGVCRSARSDYLASLAIILEHRWERFERILGVMPLYHTMGLHTLISMVLLNGTVFMLPKADMAACFSWIADGKVTALYLVPTLYHDLLCFMDSEGKTATINKLAFAGAPMPAGLIRRCFSLLQPEVFVNQYGCTEMIVMTTNARLKEKPASAGRPALQSRVRIVPVDRERHIYSGEEVSGGETGEVIMEASSPQSFLGYLNNDKATNRVLRDGWYFTGDLGFWDGDGELQLAGRVDDMIISGGENIYPGEIEEALCCHPLVQEAVVVGLADNRWGERVTAFVVPAGSGLTESELDGYCLKQMARYKRPRQFIFIEEVPKSGTGKVLRRRLREKYENKEMG